MTEQDWKNRKDNVRDTLAMYAMIGRTMQQRADLDAAIAATSLNPEEWPGTTNVPVALWTGEISKSLTDAIPAIIQESGLRPAEAVRDLLMFTLRYGVQIGLNWPKGRA